MDQKLTEEIMKNMPQMKNKNLQKLLKKARSNPQFMEMINSLAKQQEKKPESDPHDLKTRMKEKLRSCQMQRGGKQRQTLWAEKKEEMEEKKKESEQEQQQKQEEATTEQVQQEVHDKLAPALSKLKKQQKKKLRKLAKKIGHVTEERWTEALQKLSKHDDKTTVLVDAELQHEKAVIALYNKQLTSQASDLKEEKLEVSDEESDSELEDIES